MSEAIITALNGSYGYLLPEIVTPDLMFYGESP